MGQFPQRPMPQAPMQQPPMQPKLAPWQQPMINRFAPMQGQMPMQNMGQMPMQPQMPVQPMQQPMQQFPNAYAGFRPAGMQM